MKHKLINLWMIFLWCFTFFIPIFTKYSNCWYWSLWQFAFKGGRIIGIPSKRWGGHHWVWEDKDGVQWEYTLKGLPRYSPWWKMIVYKGFVRKFRTRS